MFQNKVNNFAVNDQQAKEKEIRFLAHLYNYIVGKEGGTFKFLHDVTVDDDSSIQFLEKYGWLVNDLNALIQDVQRHGTDVIVEKGGKRKNVWYENKIVQFPKSKQTSRGSMLPAIPYKHFCLETWSSTISGKEQEGWMHTSCADKLTYAFQMLITGLPEFYDTYIVQDMKQFKRYFWGLDLTRYHIHTEPEENRTRSVLIPIQEVLAHFPDTKRYFVFETRVMEVKQELRTPILEIAPNLKKYLDKIGTIVQINRSGK